MRPSSKLKYVKHYFTVINSIKSLVSQGGLLVVA